MLVGFPRAPDDDKVKVQDSLSGLGLERGFRGEEEIKKGKKGKKEEGGVLGRFTSDELYLMDKNNEGE